MLTDWNFVQQLVRKAAGYVSATLITYGAIDKTIEPVVIGVIMGVAEVGWWLYWNKFRKV